MSNDIQRVSLVVSGGRRVQAIMSRPSSPGPWPAIVAIHELFGIDDEMVKQVRHLAGLGYLALMPDLYTDGGARRCLIGTLRSLRSGRGKAYADIEAARLQLLADPSCNGAVGVLGFCMGGGFALMTAASGFVVASANYGDVPRHVEDTLAGACPIVGSYGRKDVLNRGASAKLEAALSRLDIPHDIKEYPGAGHAFMNSELNGWPWTRPIVKVLNFGPRPDAAADAWRRIDAFLHEHLVVEG